MKKDSPRPGAGLGYGLVALLAALAVTLTVLAGPGIAVAAPEVHKPTGQDLSAWLDGVVPTLLERDALPGATVVVVHGGEVVALHGYGTSDQHKAIPGAAPVDPARHLFRAGSVSKVVTATAVMQQVQQGRLDLDADVRRYLDFALQLPKGPVTLRHLLSHTAGFEEWSGPDPDQHPDLRAHLTGGPPQQIFAPGTTPAYSNYSYALAGYLVQRVTGQRFEQYVQRAILDPLEMSSSSFDQPLPAGLRTRLVASFPTPGSSPEPFRRTAAPEGALSTTSADMAAFVSFQLGHGPGTVLPRSTLAAMHAPALPPESLHGLAAGEQMTLGLDRWEIRGHPVLSHGGDVGAFHTMLALFPNEDLGLFVSFNGTGTPGIDSNQLRDQLLSPFADRYVVAPDRTAPQPLAGGAERAAAVAGSYLNQRRVASTFIAGLYSLRLFTISAHPDGTLGVRDRFSPEYTFEEVKPWLWREVGGITTLAAGRDSAGRVTAIAFAGNASAGRVGFLHGHLIPYVALALALAVLVVTLVAWPLGWLGDRRRGSRDPDRRSRLARRLAYASAAPVLAGFGLLMTSIRFDGPVDHPVARAGQALLLLGILGVIPATVHLVSTLRQTRRVRPVLAAGALSLALGYILALAITFPLIWPPG